MSSGQEAYEKLLPIYHERETAPQIRRNRTENAVFHETIRLIDVAKADRAHFVNITRFDISLIDTLQLRFDAWDYLIALSSIQITAKNRSEADWVSFSQPAKELKRRFIHRRKQLAIEENDRSVLEELKSLAGGKGKKNLITDFAMMNGMIERDRPKLAAIGLDALFQKMVFNTEKTLNRLFWELTKPDAEREEMLKLLAVSYTYLAEAVNAICIYGRLIFDGNSRAKEYISHSLHINSRKRIGQKRKKDPTPEESE